MVVSEGKGAKWLAEQAADTPRRNLILLPYQPWERMSEMLATADVLAVLLESDAGAYSVPSKVLTYLCAGRPVVGAIPEENLAARTLRRAGAGAVVEPGDHAAFVAALKYYLGDPEERARRARRLGTRAESLFDIASIANDSSRR